MTSIVDFMTLCVEHIEGYAGVMIGILCARSPGYNWKGAQREVAQVVLRKKNPHSRIPHADVQGPALNMTKDNGLWPRPV